MRPASYVAVRANLHKQQLREQICAIWASPGLERAAVEVLLGDLSGSERELSVQPADRVLGPGELRVVHTEQVPSLFPRTPAGRGASRGRRRTAPAQKATQRDQSPGVDACASEPLATRLLEPRAGRLESARPVPFLRRCWCSGAARLQLHLMKLPVIAERYPDAPLGAA